MNSRSGARLKLVGVAALFSTGGAAVKASALGAWQITGFRSGIAAVVLLLALSARRDFWRLRCLGVGVAYAATLTLYVAANKTTTAANAIFLQSTAPLYLLLLGPWLLRERVTRRDLLFAGSLLIGMLSFFAGSEAPQLTAPNPFLGNLYGAACGLTWALTLLGLRWLARDDERDGTHLAGGAAIAGNLIAFGVALPFALPVQSVGAIDWGVVAYLGLFQVGLAYVWMAAAIRHVPVVEASLLLLLEPVLNTGLTWWLHGETPAPWSLFGCVVILLATMTHTLYRR